MCFKIFLAISQVLVLVSSEKSRFRKARLFSFDTNDADIRIDLDFSVPFIRIPVKKTVDAASSFGFPTININPASIALGGVIVMATTVLIPHMLKTYASENPNQRYSKLLKAADFEAEDLLEFASKMLAESRSVRGCALRVACWTGQVPVNNDFMKIWDHVLSNKLISSMVNSTAVEDAVLSGRQGRDCSTYRPCPLREHHLPILMTNAAFLANGLLYK